MPETLVNVFNIRPGNDLGGPARRTAINTQLAALRARATKPGTVCVYVRRG